MDIIRVLCATESTDVVPNFNIVKFLVCIYIYIYIYSFI